MHYSVIKKCDIANGSGVRVSLFVSGCTNHCKNCFQPETWDFGYGKEFTDETIEEIINLLNRAYINGLTVLGGEPMEPENQRGVLPLIRAVRERFPEKNIWMYSGFTYEQLHENGSHCKCEVTEELLSMIDVLVDGRFVEDLKDITLKFRGSSNQRLIDVRSSLAQGNVVIWDK